MSLVEEAAEMDLVVYGATLSPFVRKVEVVLREKGIEFEQENVNIFPAPDWFAEISPAKRIPVLRDRSVSEDAVIPDSSAICAYLERKYPDPSLYPSDDFAFARALWYEEYADSELAGVVGLGFFRPLVVSRLMKREPDLERARTTLADKLPPLIDYLNAEIGDREFFVADRFGMADIGVATQFVNLRLAIGPLDSERWPALRAYLDRIHSRPSFQASIRVCEKIAPEPISVQELQ